VRSCARSHFQQKIIRSFNDTVPLIIGVMRRLMSDNNNEYSTYILQTINEIREQLESNTEKDFLAREEALNRMVHEIDQDIEEIDS